MCERGVEGEIGEERGGCQRGKKRDVSVSCVQMGYRLLGISHACQCHYKAIVQTDAVFASLVSSHSSSSGHNQGSGAG